MKAVQLFGIIVLLAAMGLTACGSADTNYGGDGIVWMYQTNFGAVPADKRDVGFIFDGNNAIYKVTRTAEGDDWGPWHIGEKVGEYNGTKLTYLDPDCPAATGVSYTISHLTTNEISILKRVQGVTGSVTVLDLKRFTDQEIIPENQE